MHACASATSKRGSHFRKFVDRPERPQGAASFPLRAGLLSLQPAAKAGARRVPGRWRQYRERRSLSRRLTPYTCVRRRFQVRVLGGSGRLALRNGGLQSFVSFKRSPRVLRRRRKPTAVAPKGYASGRVAAWPRGVTVALGTLNPAIAVQIRARPCSHVAQQRVWATRRTPRARQTHSLAATAKCAAESG